MAVPAAALLAAACVAGLAGALSPRPPVVKPYYDLNDAQNIYNQFLATHSKVYGAEEYKMRFEIFKESLRRVNELNSKYNDTWFTIYHFADLTKEEINNYMGFKPRNASVSAAEPLRLPAGLPEPPEAFDWRDHGAVSPVKDQGDCGSCYIFSAIGNIEGQQAIKHKTCISLSEQQCLDCLDNGGCNGGIMEQVMQQLAEDHAACMKEAEYPYKAQSLECKEDKAFKVVTVTGGKGVNVPDEDALLKLLYTYGPLSVGMDAADLNDYGGGILSPHSCRSRIDHGVTLVGYGVDQGKKFWIIKNSWGTDWGEKGYLRLERGVNACSMGTGYTAVSTVA